MRTQAETRCFVNADDDPASSPAANSPASENILRVTRVPCNLLGMVLDRGRASAYAAHLLAIKCSKGPGFVLNERYVSREYGIGQRAFLLGMRTLKSAGALMREQPNHRTYAVEKLAPAGRHYVLISDALLKQSSKAVAFVLAAGLSPKATRPAQLAARIGITAKATVRKLTAIATQANALVVGAGSRGMILLARRGTKLDPVKNDMAKNERAKNVTAHSKWKKGTEYETRAQEKPMGAQADSVFFKTHDAAREPLKAAERMALRLKELDRNWLLNRRLFYPQQYAHLAKIIAQYGAERVESEYRQLVLEPGSELRRQQINSWAYAKHRLAREYVDEARAA